MYIPIISSFMFKHRQFVIHASFTTKMTSFWFASQLIAHKMHNLRLPSFLYHPNIPISLPIIALKPDKLFQYTNPCKLLSSSKTGTDFPMGHNFLLLVTTKCMKPRQHVNCLNISISYQKECTRDTQFIFIMILIYLFDCEYVCFYVWDITRD